MDTFNPDTASATELRARLRKARIDLQIMERKVAALRQCTRGSHAPIKGSCHVCGATCP